jgi:2-keto-3-deoxy-L-rhamnonate aldolase RhmA
MPVRENRARQILKSGGIVFSSSVRMPEPGLCELLAAAGFDWVLIDGEHGALDGTSMDRLVQGCLVGGTVPVVRVLRNDDPEAIMHALDLGAQGILLPHCRTADDARRLCEAALYPPRGRRGFGPGRGQRWGAVPNDEYFRTIDETILLLALIEDPEAVENVEAIAATGPDVLWVGTGDLALAWGVPGQRRHPQVIEAARRVLDACRRHNIAAGYPVADADEARWAIGEGFRAIGYGTAEQYVVSTGRSFLAAAHTGSGQ